MRLSATSPVKVTDARKPLNENGPRAPSLGEERRLRLPSLQILLGHRPGELEEAADALRQALCSEVEAVDIAVVPAPQQEDQQAAVPRAQFRGVERDRLHGGPGRPAFDEAVEARGRVFQIPDTGQAGDERIILLAKIYLHGSRCVMPVGSPRVTGVCPTPTCGQVVATSLDTGITLPAGSSRER